MQNELFEYEINDGSVTIVKYLGHESEVTIPPEIDGKPVTRIGSRAFADCAFLTSVTLPENLTDYAEDAFENCPDLELYQVEEREENESEEEIGTRDDELSNENALMISETNETKDQDEDKEIIMAMIKTRHLKLVPADFREPFSSEQNIQPPNKKRTKGVMSRVFFDNFLMILFLSLLTVFADLVFSAGLAGWISFVQIGCSHFSFGLDGVSHLINSGINHSECVDFFMVVFLIVSWLFFGPFFTGFIRIMYAMALKRPYSRKLFLSGFDRSFWGITITRALLYANIFLGAYWFVNGTEFKHYPPVYTVPPLFFINTPISIFLIAMIVIQAGKRISITKAMSVANYVPIIKNSIVFFGCAFLSLIVVSFVSSSIIGEAYLFSEGDLHALFMGFLLFLILIVPTYFYFVAVITRICPFAFIKNSSETENPSEGSRPLTAKSSLKITHILACLFIITGFIPAYLILSGKFVNLMLNMNPELVQETDSSLFEYQVNETGVSITGYIGSEPKIQIPSKIKGKSVTSISFRSYFNDCSFVKSVVIPDGVTKIEDHAFMECRSLESVTIPGSVTEIGRHAFSDCTSLTSVVIPEGVTEIGDQAFSGCGSLKSVEISEGVTKIGELMFWNCSSLESVTIPESVREIRSHAFSCCGSLKSVELPEGATVIGEHAFAGCSSLTSVVIPEGVTAIGDKAFSGCSSLTSVTIPKGVTAIGDKAFAGCSSLTSVTIPESVTEIGESAFEGCSSLTSVVIPESVTEIYWSVFRDCPNLTIHAPKGSKAEEYAKEKGIPFEAL